MSGKRAGGEQRLSQEKIKSLFKSYKATELVAHLASVKLDAEQIDELVDILRRGGIPLIKHADDAAKARRTACVAAVTKHVEEALGSVGAAKISDLAALIDRIETGYERILASTDASGASGMPPETRVAAILLTGARAFEDQRGEMVREMTASPMIDPFGIVVGARDGSSGTDPDVALDVVIRSVTMSLLMEGHRRSWFDKAGKLILPEPDAIGGDEVKTVWPVLFWSMSWRFWEYVEESCRYFGGDIVDVDPSTIPPVLVERGVTSVRRHEAISLSWSALDIAANERLHQQLMQNRQEMEFRGIMNDRAVGLADRAALFPDAIVSADEAHSAYALDKALSTSIHKDKSAYRGLRLVEWLRGYAVLQKITAEAHDRAGHSPESLLHVMDRVTLERTLQRQGLGGASAGTFIDCVTLDRSSRDMFDTPLVALRGGKILLFGPALISAIAAQTTLSRLATLKQSFESRGKAFEREMLAFFKKQGLQAVSVRLKRDGEEYDYDLLVRWDDYVFLFECKSRSLSGNDTVASYYFCQEVGSQIGQVKRLVRGLESHPDILDSHLGAGASKLTLVPCVLNTLPFSTKDELDGVYFTDASALYRLFESPAFNLMIGRPASADRPAAGIVIPHHRLWAGESIVASDLMRQLKDPPQLKMMMARLNAQLCQSPLSENELAAATRIVRTPGGGGMAMAAELENAAA